MGTPCGHDIGDAAGRPAKPGGNAARVRGGRGEWNLVVVEWCEASPLH